MSKNKRKSPNRNNKMQFDKAKDFKKSIKRNLKELKPFKVLVIISLILSALGSVLSLFAPDKLKELTDTITEGLIVNQENIKALNEKIATNYKNGIQQEIKIDNTTVSIIDQQQYIEKTKNLTKDANIDELYKKIDELPESIKTVISPKMNMKKIKNTTITLVVLYAISAIFNLFEGLVMSTVSNKFAKDLRTKITKKINKLPLKFFDKHQTGDILSRVTNDVDTYATIDPKNTNHYITSHKYIEFHNCEIDYNSVKTGYPEMGQEGFSPEYTIDIYFDDCYETRYNEFIAQSIGDMVMWDVNNDSVYSVDAAEQSKRLSELESRSNVYKSSLFTELGGAGARFVNETINKIKLGNLYTFSLSNLKDQISLMNEGHLFSTIGSTREYLEDNKKAKMQYVKQIGNLFSAKSTISNI